MQKFRLFFLLLSAIFVTIQLKAQDSEPFKPSGKVIARSFIEFSQGFRGAEKESGFDITRAFLGYNYRITPTIQAQVIIDGASGKSSSGAMEVYVRNAFINWKDQGFDISIGEIGMLGFNTQEEYWKHRYVLKSFQDNNKMLPSVDLGVTAQYTFNPTISADISITNGEGYKVVKKDNSLRYSGGLTVHPISNIALRVYGDVYTEDEVERGKLPENVTDATYKNQYTLALFAGYRNEKISSGVEYNKVFNKDFIQSKDYFGYSAYASVKVAPKWRVYGRYDIMDSSKPSTFVDPWNTLDGQLIIGGVEFQPIKQLKISPNFRNINPNRNISEQYVFINLEFNL